MEGENFEQASANYPPPQITVEAARDVGPPIEPVVAAPVDQAIDVGFVEVGGAVETMKEILAAAWNNVVEPVWDQAVLPALEKLIPEGAQEIANSLFLGNGYTPYGVTAQAVPMGEGGVHGTAAVEPAIEAPDLGGGGYQVFGPEMTQSPAMDEFNAMLAEAAQRSIQNVDRDMGMDR